MGHTVWFDGSRWHVEGYIILGDKEQGYDVCEECDDDEFEDAEVLETFDDFESAMVWCFNS